MAKVLLLEDDTSLNETISEYLRSEGLEVDSATSIQEAEEKVYEHRYDVMILDVNLPDGNGFDFLDALRKDGNVTPALFLTSRDRIEDLEVGFQSGADDYIRKPFDIKELRLRIDTLIKRNFYHRKSEYIEFNERIRYDITNETLLEGNKAVKLGKKEARLLKIFIQNSGNIVSHEQLFDYVWDYDETPSDAALRTYIKNLRKVIGKEHIVSFKKQGYRFVIEE